MGMRVGSKWWENVALEGGEDGWMKREINRWITYKILLPKQTIRLEMDFIPPRQTLVSVHFYEKQLADMGDTLQRDYSSQ